MLAGQWRAGSVAAGKPLAPALAESEWRAQQVLYWPPWDRVGGVSHSTNGNRDDLDP